MWQHDWDFCISKAFLNFNYYNANTKTSINLKKSLGIHQNVIAFTNPINLIIVLCLLFLKCLRFLQILLVRINSLVLPSLINCYKHEGFRLFGHKTLIFGAFISKTI